MAVSPESKTSRRKGPLRDKQAGDSSDARDDGYTPLWRNLLYRLPGKHLYSPPERQQSPSNRVSCWISPLTSFWKPPA